MDVPLPTSLAPPSPSPLASSASKRSASSESIGSAQRDLEQARTEASEHKRARGTCLAVLHSAPLAQACH